MPPTPINFIMLPKSSIKNNQNTLKNLSLTRVGIREIFQKKEALFKTGKYSKFSVEGTFAKEEIENSYVVDFPGLPIGVCHIDLVQICQVNI